MFFTIIYVLSQVLTLANAKSGSHMFFGPNQQHLGSNSDVKQLITPSDSDSAKSASTYGKNLLFYPTVCPIMIGNRLEIRLITHGT